MPRFNTFSEAVEKIVAEKAPRINFPQGSALNEQVGRIPFQQSTNFLTKPEGFVWGFSTWGVDKITKKYKPDSQLWKIQIFMDLVI